MLEPNVLIDSHCHLTDPPLDAAVDAVLSRAAAAGVERVVVPSVEASGWPAVASLAARCSMVVPAFGVHPWEACSGVDVAALAVELERDGVAVGEIGLDFKVDVDRGAQRAVFEAQVGLAVDLALPVVLHCRGAFDELIEVLARYRPRGVVHAYSRGPELAARLLELGMYLGFGGAVTRPRAARARRSATAVPLGRIVLETDAPSIGVEGVMPEQTEPRHVAEVARAVAELRGLTVEEVARVTTENARELFRLG